MFLPPYFFIVNTFAHTKNMQEDYLFTKYITSFIAINIFNIFLCHSLYVTCAVDIAVESPVGN